MIKTTNSAEVEITSARQLRNWLEINHAQEESTWLVTYKKHVSDKYVSVSEILDEILCFGWIDGVRRKLDENLTMQLLSTRQTQHWAQSYKLRAARLIAQGRMSSFGLASIAESKRKGLWNFMDDVDALVIREDFAEHLKTFAPAAENFAAFSVSYRRNVLRWIKIAKTQSTRAKRIDLAVNTAAKKEKLPQM